MKENLWKVFWWVDGTKKVRHFIAEKPTEAVAYAKELKKQGHKVEVVSGRKAYRPTDEQRINRESGQLWCPYCIKYRVFKIFAIRRPTYVSSALLRCPVCTVSTDNYYTIRYNDFRGASAIMSAGTQHDLKVRRRRRGK